MDGERRGRCAACGAQGRGEDDFLCDRCVNPQGGMLVCMHCGARVRLTYDELQAFVADVPDVEKPIPPATTLVIPDCRFCNPADIDNEEDEREILVLTARHALS